MRVTFFSFVVSLVLPLLLAACGGDDGPPGGVGGDGVQPLVAVRAEASGVRCAQGGSRIEAGADLDGDGTLATSEVGSTQYVCNGESGGNGPGGGGGVAGLNALVQMLDEAGGANCAAGGKKINVGTDGNADGQLEASEIGSTGYLCNGTNGVDGYGLSGKSGRITLVRIAGEPAGANCTYGGSKVSAGLDSNVNGVLDASEVTSSSFVCNGAPGANGSNGLGALVKVSAEAAGAHCASGGSKIEAGQDADRNGTLAAAEVTSTQYVCHGAAGAAGSDGLNTLVKMQPEPGGANCAAGGSRVDAGTDANRNGALDAGEVGSTGYVCSGTNGTNGTDGLTTLVSIVGEPAGANCTYGGSRASTGPDGNADGVLDTGEITSTSYICSGAPGANGSNGLGALVKVSAEPAGAQCVEGGSKIEAGQDTDGNGALAASEVTSTQYACGGVAGAAGSDGQNTLVKMLDEAAGANCAAGGKRIDAGTDANANGVLDAGEVDSTGYVCNGTNGGNGTNGTNGLSTLLNVVGEPAGANCADGGSRISSGVDSDASGVLEAGEVTSTSYICNGAPAETMSWVTVTGNAVQADPNTGYIASNDAEPVVVTLPASPAVGDTVRVSGAGVGGWKIAQNAGQAIYTKNLGGMGGATWTARESNRNWFAVASSADGSKLVAVVRNGGQIYTSTNSGVTWTARESNRNWQSVASSADGSKLVAGEYGGRLYTSTDSGVTWTARESDRSWKGVASSADGSKLVAVVLGDQVYTSTDSGANWTPRDTARDWQAVASSADGSKLVAVVQNGQIYTSGDGGVTWTARETSRTWTAVASSADGSKLVAVARFGQIYTSGDSGVTWTAREASRLWTGVASSADGSRLVASVALNGQIYTSTDSGATWTARASSQSWTAVASSADGSKLVAVVGNSGGGGQIYTSIATTTLGTGGSISGAQFDAIELQHLGAGLFNVLSFEAGSSLTIQ